MNFPFCKLFVELSQECRYQMVYIQDRPDTKLELHKKEPKKLELQKKEPSKLELQKKEPIQKRTLLQI